MRRISDLTKIADLIKTNFKSGLASVQSSPNGSIDVYAPYLPSNILSMVSSNVRIGVFPYSDEQVLINIYKF